MSELDIHGDKLIDLHALDQEWLRQATVMERWGTHEANMEKHMTDAKNNLELVRAQCKDDIERAKGEVFLRVRKNLAQEKERVTDTLVNASILTDPHYIKAFNETQEKLKKALNELSEATHSYNLAHSAVKAIEHKRYALEHEVRLWLGKYWSEPRMDKQTKEASAENAVDEHRRALNDNPRLRRRAESREGS